VTFGASIPHEDIYTSILERRFASAGYGVEVINAGVGGYQAEQEYSYYYGEGYLYKPDIVMVGLVLNDIDPVNIGRIRENFKQYNSELVQDSPARLELKKYCRSCVFANSALFNYKKFTLMRYMASGKTKHS
jgi:hypothetical protein